MWDEGKSWNHVTLFFNPMYTCNWSRREWTPPSLINPMRCKVLFAKDSLMYLNPSSSYIFPDARARSTSFALQNRYMRCYLLCYVYNYVIKKWVLMKMKKSSPLSIDSPSTKSIMSYFTVSHVILCGKPNSSTMSPHQSPFIRGSL